MPKRYLRWNKELTEADRDGFIHEFSMLLDDPLAFLECLLTGFLNDETVFVVTRCSKTMLRTSLAGAGIDMISEKMCPPIIMVFSESLL